MKITHKNLGELKPGLYDFYRETDQTGVSGTGRVAQIAIFADGTAVTRWMTGRDSTVTWARESDAIYVHLEAHPDCGYLKRVE